MAMKAISKALQIVDHVMRFSQQYWNEELDQCLMTTAKNN